MVVAVVVVVVVVAVWVDGGEGRWRRRWWQMVVRVMADGGSDGRW